MQVKTDPGQVKKLKIVQPPKILDKGIKDLFLADCSPDLSPVADPKNPPNITKILHEPIAHANQKPEEDDSTLNILLAYKNFLAQASPVDTRREQIYRTKLDQICREKDSLKKWQMIFDAWGPRIESLSEEEQFDLLLALVNRINLARSFGKEPNDILVKLFNRLVPPELIEAIHSVLLEQKVSSNTSSINYIDLIDPDFLLKPKYNREEDKGVFFRAVASPHPKPFDMSFQEKDGVKITKGRIWYLNRFSDHAGTLFSPAEEAFTLQEGDKDYITISKAVFNDAQPRPLDKLYDIFQHDNPLTLIAFFWCAMIAADLAFENNQETHCDIKPDNVHVYNRVDPETGIENTYIELFDWKQARVENKLDNDFIGRQGYCNGTRTYHPASYYQDLSAFKLSDLDVFTAGLSLWEILFCGRVDLFSRLQRIPAMKKQYETASKNLDFYFQDGSFKSFMPKDISKEVLDLLRDMTSNPPKVSMKDAIKRLALIYKSDIETVAKTLSQRDKQDLRSYLDRNDIKLDF